MPPIMPPADMDLIAPGPILITGIAAMAALLLELVTKERQKGLIALVSGVGVVLAMVNAMFLWNANRPPAYAGMLVSDNLSVFASLIILGVALVTLLMAPAFLDRLGLHRGEFYALLLLATSGGVMLALSGDLIMVFLGIELLSISLYVMTGYARGQIRSEEAALKYFLLGSFSIGFFIYGSALIYGATGTTNLAAMAKQVAALAGQDNALLVIGMALLVIGFGFKLALVPFHQWTPDVYDGAPTLVTAYMSVATKVAIFAALIRVLFSLDAIRSDWAPALWFLAAITMLVGNVAALAQSEVKRLLAYSSIGHAGYILTAIYAGSPDSWSAALFYLLSYAAMNLGVFAVIIALGLTGEATRRLENYAGLFARRPYLAVALTVFLLSLAGLPPTAGFWGKFYAFQAAVAAGPYGIALAIIGVLSSVVAAYYYLRFLIILYRPATAAEQATPVIASPLLAGLAVALALVLTVQIGVYPTGQLDATRASRPTAASTR